MGKIKTKVTSIYTDVKKHWDKPREGEFLSNKQFMYFCLAGMFFMLFNLGGLGFGGWFAHNIMQIRAQDFVAIGIIGMVMGYVTIFMQPFHMLIFENLGVLDKKKRNIFHILVIVKALVGIAFYFVPRDFGQQIIIGFPLIIGNMLFLSSITDYLNYGIRWLFCRKYGRYKPMVVVSTIPAIIGFAIIPWLPVQHMDYAVRLAILHGVFHVVGWFVGFFNGGSHYGFINLITQSGQERVRIWSFATIAWGFLLTFFAALFPILITSTMFGRTFTGWDDIWMFRIISPAIGLLAILGTVFILPLKEDVQEQQINRPKVEFFRGAKQVFANKYWWITNISGVLGAFSGMFGNLLGWWFIYQLRMPALQGIFLQLIIGGATLGQILTPSITKRFDLLKIFLTTRFILVFTFLIQGALFFFSDGAIWGMSLFMIIAFINNVISAPTGVINQTFNGNILDYHQWKTGERGDSVVGVFGWITSPIHQAIGLIGPFLWMIGGWTSDWEVLWNHDIFRNLMLIGFLYSIIGTVLSIIPWFFFDLTAEKHKKMVAELGERARARDIAEIEKHKEEGRLSEIDPELLKKYGYDSEGNLTPEEIEKRARERIKKYKEEGKIGEIEPELLEKYGYDSEGNLIPTEEEEAADGENAETTDAGADTAAETGAADKKTEGENENE